MSLYRKKPTVIEAVQWFPDSERLRRIGYDRYGVEYTVTEQCLLTAHGPVRLKPGDWIASQTVNGVVDRWPIADEIFQATYEPAREGRAFAETREDVLAGKVLRMSIEVTQVDLDEIHDPAVLLDRKVEQLRNSLRTVLAGDAATVT